MTNENKTKQSTTYVSVVIYCVSVNGVTYLLPAYDMLDPETKKLVYKGSKFKDLSEQEVKHVIWVSDTEHAVIDSRCGSVTRHLLKKVMYATHYDQAFRKKFGIRSGIENNHITERGLLICNAIKVKDYGVDRLNSLAKFINAEIVVLTVENGKAFSKIIKEIGRAHV